MSRRDVVLRAIEAAYSPERNKARWLRGILNEINQLGAWEAGGYCLVDGGARHEAVQGFDCDFETLLNRAEMLPAEVLKLAHVPAPRIETNLARVTRLVKHLGLDLASLLGGADVVLPLITGVLAVNAVGTQGVLIGLPAVDELSVRDKRALTQIAVHVETAFRLRENVLTGSEGASDAELRATPELEAVSAVLSPTGELMHADEEAQQAGESLALSVKRLDEARGKLRHLDPEAAAELWRAMVAGKWTLVEHTESDGKRLILAVENPPESAIGGLSRSERQIASFASLGHSQKEIGYELGLSPSEVSVQLRRALGKLRLKDKAELVRVFGPFTKLVTEAKPKR